MSAFDFTLRTRMVYGPGVAESAGELAFELGAKRVVVVTDPGIVAEGYAEHVEQVLGASGIEVYRYADVRPNPTSADVSACLAAVQDFDVDLWVGLGGGSSIDVAKGCNLLRAGGGRMEDYWGVHKAKGQLQPLIAIPTTAGTGTEVQSFALIAQEDSKQKMACGDPQLSPRIAILDPCLTVTKPQFLTACTGLDTVGHAVETAVTTRRNPMSRMFSVEAFRLASNNLARVLKHPDDLEARGRMLRASAYGGIAIETSMLGAAHSIANPLTANFNIPHGQAVGMMLPHVVRFNAQTQSAATSYAELARAAGLCAHDAPDIDGVDALVRNLRALLVKSGFPATLGEFGVTPSVLDDLARESAQQWTAQFNPRSVTAADFRELLAAACVEGD